MHMRGNFSLQSSPDFSTLCAPELLVESRRAGNLVHTGRRSSCLALSCRIFFLFGRTDRHLINGIERLTVIAISHLTVSERHIGTENHLIGAAEFIGAHQRRRVAVQRGVKVKIS